MQKAIKKTRLRKSCWVRLWGGGGLANQSHYLVCSQSSDTLSSLVRLQMNGIRGKGGKSTNLFYIYKGCSKTRPVTVGGGTITFILLIFYKRTLVHIFGVILSDFRQSNGVSPSAQNRGC